jgi:hypothetical protein
MGLVVDLLGKDGVLHWVSIACVERWHLWSFLDRLEIQIASIGIESIIGA